jgi:hypothetical protein
MNYQTLVLQSPEVTSNAMGILCLPVLNIVEDTENAYKQINEVEIQGNSAHDKFIRAELLGDDVRLIRRSVKSHN